MMQLRLLLITLAFMMMPSLQAQQLFPTTEGELRKYAATISFRDNQITGVLMIKRDEKLLLGTLVNEFGIRAFDLTVNPQSGKVKLQDVMSFLNKWYIKKLIRADLKQMFLFDHSSEMKVGRNRKLKREGDIIELQNTKYGIIYNFRLLPQTETEQ